MGLSIFKLRDMLAKAKIDYSYNEIATNNQLIMHQIKIYDGREFVISVIQGPYSYGGEQNLLEIMGLLTDEEFENDSVLGYQSAKDVFERIQKWHRERFKEDSNENN